MLWKFLFVLIVLTTQGSRAQGEECTYGPGSIATSVILTIIVTTLLLFVGYLIWKRYWTQHREKHLVLETDPEKGPEEYAYDNAAFGETSTTTTPPFQKVPEKNGKVHSGKSKWTQWSPLGALATTKNEKGKTSDDSVLQKDQVKIVSLKSHDFTGLGFNIYGNMRDGIFIKDILHRGPASESGKLNSGDRIKSITINFEHVVYEDALTILSYASPYEVILEAQGGKTNVTNQLPSKTVNLGHPLYRSASSTDLIQIQKTTRKRLFTPESTSTTSSPYSSLQKEHNKSQSPDQLKSQLEQKIFNNHKQQLKTKDDKPPVQENDVVAVPKTENKYQKFGIKVLPVNPKPEQISPKSSELSQNDNNINLERHLKVSGTTTDGVDEVDKLNRKPAPPVKKREKNPEESFERNDLNGSGIKRDKDGIPQEIPTHMLNAAVAARRNRKASVENLATTEEIKSPKKPKGRAPAPPEEKIKADVNKKEYTSDDSDAEPEISSSVNTIELNPSDITIHQTEETDETQNRRTASTGDLTKIQKTRKTSTGTLERAQSLDITDTTIPTLNKKRKGSSIEDDLALKSGSDDSLYGNALMHKEPRLDGLNTFQRSRLKKSTEWGNLEDAIVNLDKEEERFKLEGDDDVDVTVSQETILFEPPPPVPLESPPSSITSFQEPKHLIIYANSVGASENLLHSERHDCVTDPYYSLRSKIYDTNVSDDMKVSRHSLGSLEAPDSFNGGNVSSITIGEVPKELYTTALDATLTNESSFGFEKVSVVSPTVSLTETYPVTIDGPGSLTLEILGDVPKEDNNLQSTVRISSPEPKSNFSLTYITEIQVSTPKTDSPSPDAENRKINIESPIQTVDLQKELDKIQELAEEQLKKLPEMRFSASYEAPKSPENFSSQIEQLRSNFEKGPSKSPPKIDTTKSRIPVATGKTPPTSPERRDSRNFDLEVDKEIVAIMSSPVHSTPIKYQPKIATKNVSITSIRTNSKIPANTRPPVPPRKFENSDGETRFSTNGNVESSFKHWVFNPDNGGSLTLGDKPEQK